ncbi:MAG: MFS transporter [Candidatus Nanopelagicales bacterium]
MSDTGAPAKKETAGFNRAAVTLLGVIGGIQVFDPVVSSVALVQAGSDLKFPASTMALAAGISTLALAATVIPGGLIADRLGRRRVLMGALVVTAIGELTTAFGLSISMYLLGRVIAGIALGVVFGAAYGLLRDVAPADKLGPAMGLFNVMNLVLTAVVVVIAGILILTSWRLAYLLAPIACAVCFILIPKILPNVPKVPGGKLDILGMVLIGLGVVGLLYGVSNAAQSVTSPSCWGPILFGLIALVVFAAVESKRTYAVFPIRLLTHPAFLGAVIMGIFWNFANGAASQMLPNVWQYIEGWGTGRVAVYQVFIALFAACGAVWGGRLLGRGTPAKNVSGIGYIMMVAGFLALAVPGVQAGILVFIPGMILAAFGWMSNATSQGSLFIGLAPKQFFGPVTSSKVTVGQFGYSLGLSGSTALISLLTLNKVSDATNGAVSGDDAWTQITEYLQKGTTGDSALAQISRDAIASMYVSSFRITLVIFAVIIAVAGLAMYRQLGKAKAAEPVEEFLSKEIAALEVAKPSPAS